MRIASLLLFSLAALPAADVRVGIIGTDTSHVVVFTQMFNDPARADHVPGVKVVAAFKGGSPDIDSSWSRVDKYAEELRTKWNLSMEPDIPSLCAKVDAILLESNDGRKHLPQAKLVIAARKPLFIDKPLASTLEDAREIARLAKEAGVPFFSSSSARFGGIATSMKFKDVIGVTVWGPAPLEPHHYMDLSWYAIHPIELLYTLMGTGCEQVTRIATDHSDAIVGRWKDGRLGTVNANRPHGAQGAAVFRANNQVVQSDKTMEGGYGPLLKQIVKFFQTKTPPVAPEETLEIMAFMDAAQRSKEAGGKPMRLR
jgi:Oxidoreductase family, NAD-binding Rossmann fold